MTTDRASGNGFGARTVAKLAGELRQHIAKGKMPAGSFMPTERELSAQYEMAKMTTRRALKLLESEGLVVAVPRQGYRVLGRAGDPHKGAPLAYVLSGPTVGGGTVGLLESTQRMAARRRWSLLTIESDGRTSGEIMQQLAMARASGVILGRVSPELLQMVHDAGIPAIADDAWPEDADIDVVTQDGFHGGMIATTWLLSRGHKRIAFLGLDVTGGRPQVVERYSGYTGMLAQAGLQPPLAIHATTEGEAEQAAVELLSRVNRPTGIVAPWREMAVGVVRAIRRLDLTLGTEVDVVGWCTRERYESDWRQTLSGGVIPPAVVWSVEECAETMVTRLEQRRRDPKLPTIHLRIPVRLKFAE